MEDDLPPKKMQPKTNLQKADFFAILKNSTAQLFPGNLTNTKTKNILAQLKKNQPQLAVT